MDTIGSYRCQCNQGYQLVNSKICKGENLTNKFELLENFNLIHEISGKIASQLKSGKAFNFASQKKS